MAETEAGTMRTRSSAQSPSCSKNRRHDPNHPLAPFIHRATQHIRFLFVPQCYNLVGRATMWNFIDDSGAFSWDNKGKSLFCGVTVSDSELSELSVGS